MRAGFPRVFNWTTAQSWTLRTLARNAYRLPLYDMDDLQQEARIVMWKIDTKYSDAVIAERLEITPETPNYQRSIARSRMALYKIALANHLTGLARRQRVKTSSTTDERAPEIAAREDGVRELELRIDVERSPQLRALLERSNYELEHAHDTDKKTKRVRRSRVVVRGRGPESDLRRLGRIATYGSGCSSTPQLEAVGRSVAEEMRDVCGYVADGLA